MESVLSSYTHGHSVFLSEKLLNLWDRCVVFPSVSIPVCLHRKKAATYPTALPQELLDPEKRPGPCGELETPRIVLITKISQEGETSPGAALNDACTPDLAAKTDGHLISQPHL